MCRLYGFHANEETKVECTLVHAQNALLLQSRCDARGQCHSDGWGLAYYPNGMPQVTRRAAAAYQDLHFAAAAERAYAHTVVAHVRLATVGTSEVRNTHPFTAGCWTMAHNGTLPCFRQLEERLRAETLPQLLSQRQGDTDSEQIFLWLLSRFQEAGVHGHKSARDLEMLQRVLARSIRQLDRRARAVSDETPRLNLVLTDGHVLLASRWNHSLYWLLREGVRDCEICGVPHVHHDPRTDYRAVVVASEPLSHETWLEVPERMMVVVDQALHAHLHPIAARPAIARVPGRLAADNPPSVELTAEQRQRARQVAGELAREHPELLLEESLQPYRVASWTPGRTLHLDDFSAISLARSGSDTRYQQHRARLRATSGDVVVTCLPVEPSFERYCRERLGLGDVEWLEAAEMKDPRRVAIASWRDRKVRGRLIHELRQGGLTYVHPHMGCSDVWQMARLLSRRSRRTLRVLAPPPRLMGWINDKLAFADLVRRLLGAEWVPDTRSAANLLGATRHVLELADSNRTIVVKVPDSAGGGGNVVFDAALFRGRSLTAARKRLGRLLAHLDWQWSRSLLVSGWATDVCGSPSAQLWIPPRATGPPILEGVFQQVVEGREGIFTGSCPSECDDERKAHLGQPCLMLALVLQRLGYVGRCSFDMLLVGRCPEQAKLQMIECNGRWGGTSAPMTLMKRLFADPLPAYVIRQYDGQGLESLRFDELLAGFDDILFDARSRTGWLLMYNPAQLAARGGISAVVLGGSPQEARERAERELPQRLARLKRG